MDERTRILKMVEDGKISPNEAAQLLSAMGQERAPETAAFGAVERGRWLKVRVTDTYTGRSKVNVSLPLGIVNAALRVGARFVPSEQREMVDEVARALQDGMTGKIVDVIDDDDGDHVEVFIE